MMHNDYLKALERDSFLDCGYVWNRMTSEEIVNQLAVNQPRVLGDLIPAHVPEIVRLVEAAPRITGKQKQGIKDSLGTLTR